MLFHKSHIGRKKYPTNQGLSDSGWPCEHFINDKIIQYLEFIMLIY